MISVVTCTNRGDFVKNIIESFQKQSIKEKELILVLNSTKISVDQEDLKGIKFKLLQFSEDTSLGECLNQGVAATSYNLVAKMDDDDYYGPDYLKEAIDVLTETAADLVGKSSFYIYFKKTNEIRMYNPNKENCWILNNGESVYKPENFLSGASLVFKKEACSHLSFPPVNVGEDFAFQQLCYNSQLKIYSLSSQHYVHIRYNHPRHHTSDVRDSVLRSRSRLIHKNFPISDFMKQRKR